MPSLHIFTDDLYIGGTNPGVVLKDDGGAVFNERSLSTGDVRMEGNTYAYGFFWDASADSLALGNEASPDARLHIEANSAGRAIRLEEYSGGEYWDIFVNSNGGVDFYDGSTLEIRLEDGTGYVGMGGTSNPAYGLHLTGSAAKTSGGTTWVSLSDVRTKQNIEDFTDGLSVVMNTRPREFEYNGRSEFAPYTGERNVGIIAQEFQSVAPYMIGEMEGELDGVPTTLLDYDGSAFTFVLVNAIQEQQGMIEELKAENAELRSLVEQMDARLSALEGE
jgi:hypothetical protein